jgi:hypothetical protein
VWLELPLGSECSGYSPQSHIAAHQCGTRGLFFADRRFTRHLRLNDGYSGNQKGKAALKLLGKMVAEAH